jgi:hypothetical protein
MHPQLINVDCKNVWSLKVYNIYTLTFTPQHFTQGCVNVFDKYLWVGFV